MQKSTAAHFEVSVKSLFVPDQSNPDQDFFFFAYRITIHNHGDTAAQLLHRHWIVTDGQGQVEEVRGPGVIGLQPRIQPGQKFEYESACPLATPAGSMKGFYQMLNDEGETFSVEVPEFYLVSPEALH
ncbi:MAG: Co2+/Mg2+ efflux protein ApaG [Bdellovibrionaceae bacterium]|nr:Co2+/Mg2+ efflux protein ApaG [Pseudobdellovibrionaceae bacterium]